MSATDVVEVSGHIIDSLILAKILDEIIDSGADYRIVEMDVGRRPGRPLPGPHRGHRRPTTMPSPTSSPGSIPTAPTRSMQPDAELVPADHGRRAPRRASTRPPTCRRRSRSTGTGSRWRTRRWTAASSSPTTRPGPAPPPCTGCASAIWWWSARRASGSDPWTRPSGRSPFEFMASDVSSEKPKGLLVAEVAERIRRARAGGRQAAGGVRPGRHPHRRRARHGRPGARRLGRRPLRRQRLRHPRHRVQPDGHVARAYRCGRATSTEGGHSNHLRAITEVRRWGSIRKRGGAGPPQPAA